jgi:hypothetical protein
MKSPAYIGRWKWQGYSTKNFGEKGVLSPQEIIDALDLSLAFVEENAKAFDDGAATDTARQLLEALIKIVGERHTPRESPPSENG